MKRHNAGQAGQSEGTATVVYRTTGSEGSAERGGLEAESNNQHNGGERDSRPIAGPGSPVSGVHHPSLVQFLVKPAATYSPNREMEAKNLRANPRKKPGEIPRESNRERKLAGDELSKLGSWGGR